MKILLLIACLLIERYLHIGSIFKSVTWIEKYIKVVEDKIGSKIEFFKGYIAIFILFLPMLIIMLIIDKTVVNHQLALSGVGIHFIALLYCFAPLHLYNQLQLYFHAVEKENQANIENAYKEITEEEMNPDENLAARRLTEIIFVQANNSIFGIVFWYIIWGTHSAVLYWLIARVADLARQGKEVATPFTREAIQLDGILNWLPARVLALLYVFAGGFQGISSWRRRLWTGTQDNNDILIECGTSSLTREKELSPIAENKKAIALFDRALNIFIAIVIVFSLGVWLK